MGPLNSTALLTSPSSVYIFYSKSAYMLLGEKRTFKIVV